MSKKILGERERALEDEFFYKVDQKLIRQMREKMEAEKTRDALHQATGISDSKVLDELVDLGIKTETLLALSLVPCVQVAWADRIIEQNEREAVLRAAEQEGCVKDGPSYHLIEHWLKQRPGENVMAAWKDYVAALSKVVSPESLSALRDDLVGRARTVAESAGGFLGIGAVSKLEESMLKDLEATFSSER